VFCTTIMVHVDIDGKSSGRIHVALKLANWFSSDLIGISAAILPPYPAESGYFVTLEAIEREQRDVRAALARAEASFRSIATRPARIKPSVLPAFALMRCVGADQTGILTACSTCLETFIAGALPRRPRGEASLAAPA